MIEKNKVIEFFDGCAPTWNDEMIINDSIVARILDNAEVTEGMRILDVACGTGVLMPYYISRNVASVTGVDISPKMLEIAASSFKADNIRFMCLDAETEKTGEMYDCIVVYNAFPHFPDPDRLIANLCSMLVPGGTLTVAHGMSREKIDSHHEGRARHISNGLMPAGELAELFRPYTEVIKVISDDSMYQVVGRK